MEWLFKNMPVSALIIFLPMLLEKVGRSFKNKDDNDTGNDDATGNVLIALGPALLAVASSNEPAKKKAFEVIYQTLGNYLGIKSSRVFR